MSLKVQKKKWICTPKNIDALPSENRLLVEHSKEVQYHQRQAAELLRSFGAEAIELTTKWLPCWTVALGVKHVVGGSCEPLIPILTNCPAMPMSFFRESHQKRSVFP